MIRAVYVVEHDAKAAGVAGTGEHTWLKQEVRSFFASIKRAITQALELARAAVKAVIDTAKKLAVGAIEAGRKWVVDRLHKAGDFLIALGDVAVAAFPGLREKFRGTIKALVAAGEAIVNKLADLLKVAVQALLDSWGKEWFNAKVEGVLSVGKAIWSLVTGKLDLALRSDEHSQLA